MKKQKNVWVLVILAAIVIGFILYKSEVQKQQQAPMANAITATPPTVHAAVSNSLTTPQTSVTAAKTNEAGIAARYKQGQINKGEAMNEFALAQNRPMDIYGKVVDQYGQPVIGAEVQGSLSINLGLMSQKVEYYSTETDANGLFKFLALKGSNLGIRPKKQGYLYYLKLPPQRPDNYQPDPNNLVVFDMWKLHGAAILVGQSIDAKIPHDGTSTTFDIATGKESSSGDLQVTLLRSPLEVRRSGQSFDWTLKIEMLHGGLLLENDSYPFWAPESGYGQSFKFNVSSNDVSWDSKITRNFYFRTSGGQYGRMQTDVSASLTPARIECNFTVNPSGSQNLEPPATE